MFSDPLVMFLSQLLSKPSLNHSSRNTGRCNSAVCITCYISTEVSAKCSSPQALRSDWKPYNPTETLLQNRVANPPSPWGSRADELHGAARAPLPKSELPHDGKPPPLALAFGAAARTVHRRHRRRCTRVPGIRRSLWYTDGGDGVAWPGTRRCLAISVHPAIRPPRAAAGVGLRGDEGMGPRGFGGMGGGRCERGLRAVRGADAARGGDRALRRLGRPPRRLHPRGAARASRAAPVRKTLLDRGGRPRWARSLVSQRFLDLAGFSSAESARGARRAARKRLLGRVPTPRADCPPWMISHQDPPVVARRRTLPRRGLRGCAGAGEQAAGDQVRGPAAALRRARDGREARRAGGCMGGVGG